VISEEMGEDIILCQITSKRIVKDSYSIEIEKDETEDGSLQIDSYVRENMIFTASKKQIIKRICSIPDRKYIEVTKIIYDIIRK